MNRKELLVSYSGKYIQHRRIFESEWNKCNTMDLSSGQAAVLGWLDKMGPQQAKDLVNGMSITSGGITAICDKLLGRALIRRTRSDGQDRRIVNLEITDEGRELVKMMDTVWDNVLENTFAALTTEEIAILDQLFSKLGESQSGSNS